MILSRCLKPCAKYRNCYITLNFSDVVMSLLHVRAIFLVLFWVSCPPEHQGDKARVVLEGETHTFV